MGRGGRGFSAQIPQALRPKTPKTSAGHNRLLPPQGQFAEKQPPRRLSGLSAPKAGRRPSFSAFFLGDARKRPKAKNDEIKAKNSHHSTSPPPAQTKQFVLLPAQQIPACLPRARPRPLPRLASAIPPPHQPSPGGQPRGVPLQMQRRGQPRGVPTQMVRGEGAFPRRSLKHHRPKAPKRSAGHNRLLPPQAQFAEKQPLSVLVCLSPSGTNLVDRQPLQLCDPPSKPAAGRPPGGLLGLSRRADAPRPHDVLTAQYIVLVVEVDRTATVRRNHAQLVSDPDPAQRLRIGERRVLLG